MRSGEGESRSAEGEGNRVALFRPENEGDNHETEKYNIACGQLKK